jgi:hypothetical protein
MVPGAFILEVMGVQSMAPATNAPTVPDLDLTAFAVSTSPDCSRRTRLGDRCYKAHPVDMGEWCPACLDGHDPAGPLPDWMGGIDRDGPRPTAVDHYEPTPAEAAEHLAMVAKREARDEVMAGWAAADDHHDWVAAFAEPAELLHPGELAECGYRAPINPTP